MIEVKEKICSGKHGCGEMLPIEEFHRDKNKKDGRKYTCKKCLSAHHKKCYKEDPEFRAKKKATEARFKRNNPDYIKPVVKAGYELGYVVYIIRNYDGKGNSYVGQTKNIYKRMVCHKSRGVLNTENYEILHDCKSREENVRREAALHAQGYHGENRGL